MATCDGPLACHVLQRCLQRYVSTTRKQNSDGKRPTPLEEWLIPVLGQIVDCLEQGAVFVRTVTIVSAKVYGRYSLHSTPFVLLVSREWGV